MNWWSRTFLALVMVSGLMIVARSQDKGTSPFLSEEVKFDGFRVKIAGTLLVPRMEAGRRAPGVLFLEGSGLMFMRGPTDDFYRNIATRYLVAQGMVVLSYHQRCAGASECKGAESYNDYIDDAQGALNFLRSRNEVDPGRIFLFGQGEGALIASGVAAHPEERPAGVILMRMLGRSFNKIFREAMRVRMNKAGKTPEEIDACQVKYDGVIKGLMKGETDFSYLKLDPRDPEENYLIGITQRPQAMVDLLVNDPLRVVINIKSPVLVMQKRALDGAKDAGYIEDALKRAHHPDVTISLFSGIHHERDETMLKAVAQWIAQKSIPAKVADK